MHMIPQRHTHSWCLQTWTYIHVFFVPETTYLAYRVYVYNIFTDTRIHDICYKHGSDPFCISTDVCHVWTYQNMWIHWIGGWTPDDFAIAHGKLHASSHLTVVEPMVADKFPQFTRHYRCLLAELLYVHFPSAVGSFPIG